MPGSCSSITCTSSSGTEVITQNLIFLTQKAVPALSHAICRNVGVALEALPVLVETAQPEGTNAGNGISDTSSSRNGIDAVANRGGGKSAGSAARSGDGGSWIVIIKY